MKKNDGNFCKCGFKFSGAGEFRNCEAFITEDGKSGYTCPKCQTSYINGKEIILKELERTDG